MPHFSSRFVLPGSCRPLGTPRSELLPLVAFALQPCLILLWTRRVSGRYWRDTRNKHTHTHMPGREDIREGIHVVAVGMVRAEVHLSL